MDDSEFTFARDPGLFDATMIGVGAMIGTAREPLLHKMLVGEIPEKVARYLLSSGMAVKRYEGAVKSLLKQIPGQLLNLPL